MHEHHDWRLFLSLAHTQSFTKTAAQLGLARSSVSQAIGTLEQKLGVRLFHRTTRFVALTDAGQALFERISPLFADIDKHINEVLNLHNTLTGTLRINGTPNSFYLLWDKFRTFGEQNPNVSLELIADMRFLDIVKEKFDAGIRTGDLLNQDVVAVKISDDNLMCCVASPAYFSNNPIPQTPEDLAQHNCVRVRLPTYGGLLNWQFLSPKTGEVFTQIVNGKWVFNDTQMLILSALDGMGLVWIERSLVQAYLDNGRLISALDEWAMIYPLDYLYYPNRQISPTLKALVDFLRA
ncbi:MAG: LysR family transcriptional regulator [Lonepinella koalarum]|nr:LysR family transcriptional regulator [Lonepinella koalarum]